MATDKITDAILEALKKAAHAPGEQRLYKSGKQEGLFPAKTGVSAEAAAQALRQGLLELVRTETKGKTSTDWVKITSQGVTFLHEHESPLHVLEEVRLALQTTRQGMPGLLVEMQEDVRRAKEVIIEKMQQAVHQLETLSQRVEQALRRLDSAPDLDANGNSWAMDALTYIDRRQGQSRTGACPMPELFSALRQRHADLSMLVFHDGLRRLQDRRALQLLPYTGPLSELPEPEYALLDGASVLYYVSR